MIRSSLPRSLGRLAAALVVAAPLALLPQHASASPLQPIVKGPFAQQVTSTSAVVRVELDPPGPLTLEFDAPEQKPVVVAEPRAFHSVELSGLRPKTRYVVTARSGGATRVQSIVTAPPEGSADPFRFLIYGDNRSDEAAHTAIVRAMVGVPSDFLLHTGDFVADGGNAGEWQSFFDIEAPLLRERPVFACVGNHELVDRSATAFLRYFGSQSAALSVSDGGVPGVAPELHATFRWANARFFLANAFTDFQSGAERAWLEKVLGQADGEAGLTWRIFVAHHGLYSSGPHGNNARMHQAGLAELLKRHGVDLVVSGHDHIYERGSVAGLPFLVSGGGGAPTYPIERRVEGSKKAEPARHFVEVSASRAALQIAATRTDGSTIERCALVKGAGWDCDGEPAAPRPPQGGDVAPTPHPSRCGCTVVGERAADGEVAVAALAFALVLRRRRRAA